ncbi:MAG: ATP synthase F1 subunit epsilon [Candidatus Kapaibacterium sp.]|jgi:F-type H+-transporting ATPase subunit epsilon|nr:ATP synthase F1 subunit epsilon [Candidatus Kapabacteria bacterium]
MADKILKVDIITPQSVVFSGDAVSVNVPGSLSPFEILINHAPIVSSLDCGIIKIKNNTNQSTYFATGTGFVEVNRNVVSVLVESAASSADIDRKQSAENIEKFKSELALASNNGDKLAITAKLNFEQAKLKAASLHGKQ